MMRRFVVIALPFSLSVLSLVQSGSAAGPPLLGPEIQINADSAGRQVDPSLAGNSQGWFMVDWTDQRTPFSRPFARLFDISGTPLGEGVSAEADMPDHTRLEPDIAAGTDGRFLVVWTAYGGEDGENSGIFARFFSASGESAGSQVQVNSSGAYFQQRPAVTAMPDGRYAVVWLTYDAHLQRRPRNPQVFARVLDAEGRSRSDRRSASAWARTA